MRKARSLPAIASAAEVALPATAATTAATLTSAATTTATFFAHGTRFVDNQRAAKQRLAIDGLNGRLPRRGVREFSEPETPAVPR